MTYDHIVRGIFRNRPNRFIAEVTIEGRSTVCHVKNTGRCRELLVPGATVYLQDFGKDHPNRKTRYDLIAVQKDDILINMDAQAPNKVFEEWATSQNDGKVWHREVSWGSSRFDFAWDKGEQKGFVEVKGVTLEKSGIVLFPDAPTERGVKHLRELIKAQESGFDASVCFVVQMERAEEFRPNDETHPAFGATLREAFQNGVTATARLCKVTLDSLTLGEEIPIIL